MRSRLGFKVDALVEVLVVARFVEPHRPLGSHDLSGYTLICRESMPLKRLGRGWINHRLKDKLVALGVVQQDTRPLSAQHIGGMLGYQSADLVRLERLVHGAAGFEQRPERGTFQSVDRADM